jgi:hypothetical protein
MGVGVAEQQVASSNAFHSRGGAHAEQHMLSNAIGWRWV